MSAASFQPSSPRRRATSIALAVAAHLIVLMLMLKLAPDPDRPRDPDRPLSTFQVLPEPRAVKTPSPRAVEKVKRPSGGAPRPAPKTPDAPASTAPVPPTPPFPELIGGKEMFQAADVSKIAAGKGSAASGTGEGKDSGAAYGPGEGPGGERLYNAEWYREPTSAELAFYMPPGARQSGWALIACRTVERYHVENCRALGESPVGSGLARTLRMASWQFLVRPPRVGGKTLIGAWVRIRFDFTVNKAE
jgi:hypothetical protein